MTLYVGICDQDRRADRWPVDLSLATPLEEANRFVANRLRAADFAGPSKFPMKIKGFWPLRDGIVLGAKPIDDAEDKAIRALRDQIAECVGMRLEGHDTYEFRITMAYFVGEPTDEEFAELSDLLAAEEKDMLDSFPPFEVGPGEYCLFNDMFCFQWQFFLTSGRDR